MELRFDPRSWLFGIVWITIPTHDCWGWTTVLAIHLGPAQAHFTWSGINR